MAIHHVLNEMNSTEATYRNNLGIINSISEKLLSHSRQDLGRLDQMDFAKGLELIAKIAAKQEKLAFLFHSLKDHLCDKSNDLKNEVHHNAFNATVDDLKHSFVQLAKDYANYTIFYDNYSNNIAPKLNSKKVQGAINDTGSNQLLAGLLINPIQRFPRYEMLMKELFKQIPQEHNAKPYIQSLSEHIRDTCTKINSIAEFYASVKQGYAGVNLQNDSNFRRNVKNYLNKFMIDNNQTSDLAIAFAESGLTITSKGKRFTNKRTYSFTNQGMQPIFDIVVNRHAMSFRFTEHFDLLPAHEKIALFRLQYFLTHEIENSFQAISVNDTTKHYLEILGEVEYLNQPLTLELDSDDDDDDDDMELISTKIDAPVIVAEEPNFRNRLNSLFLHHKGLTRNNSLLKQEVKNTYTDGPARIRLPGLARD